MDLISVLLIAVALAMDAFSVAISYGIMFKKVVFQDVMKIALFFGVFQFGMMYIGNFLGNSLSYYISKVDHWIAFALLMIIGIKAVKEAFADDEEDKEKNPMAYKTLTVLAVATSIDALAVGVSYASVGGGMSIMGASAIVGFVAFGFSFSGVFLGNKSGNIFGNKAEILGGLVLIGIGVKILIEHLFF